MNNIFLKTYCGNPKNFDVLRLENIRSVIETTVLAADFPGRREKFELCRTGPKRFFSPAVWNQSVQDGSLRQLKNRADFLLLLDAQFKTQEFENLIKGDHPERP
jgi:hypothetical protein